MKKVKKPNNWTKILASAFILLVFWQFELITYGFSQAYGQLQILIFAKPIDRVLEDPTISDTTKEKIIFIEKVKQFAEDSLGIKKTNNYSSYYHFEQEAILWNLTAAKAFEMKAYNWGFPIIGKFPYKGFFNTDRLKRESEKIKAKGWETSIGGVSAWSTLGWTKDPILSSMLNRSDGRLAELIIHELTHATIFVKNDATLNENIATFVGIEGAKRFLSAHFGENSSHLTDYELERIDSRKFAGYMLASFQQLDSLYCSDAFIELSEAEKLKAKRAKIQSIQEGINSERFSRPERYQRIKESPNLNNNFFLGFSRYQSKQSDFDEELVKKYEGNLNHFIKDYAELHPPKLFF
ncbi:MAG: aminopeptidase [Cyclobacteriaceae bacterium]|nr:aminopeptidase [Cyclobacteriaceae bacterium]MCH8516879.1 aminopeptidase [Cyclobacteriaceae bacterium]